MTRFSNNFSKILIPALVLALCSCGSLPKYASTAPDNSPQLSFVDAPVGAVVEIDGTPVLTVNKSLRTIGVAPGNHKVIVRHNGLVIYEDSVFIQGQTVKQIRTK